MPWLLNLLIICGKGHFGLNSIGQSKFYDQAHINLAGFMAGSRDVLSNRKEKLIPGNNNAIYHSPCLTSTYPFNRL